MLNKNLSLTTLIFGSVLALIGPTVASAHDRNEYRHSAGYSYGNTARGSYNNREVDRWNSGGVGHERWTESRNRNDYDDDDRYSDRDYNTNYNQRYDSNRNDSYRYDSNRYDRSQYNDDQYGNYNPGYVYSNRYNGRLDQSHR